MRTIRVAAVSMNGLLGDPDRVLDEIDRWCALAAAESAELVLFPELVVHGHCAPDTAALAESVPAGRTVRRLEEIGARHGVTLAVGMSEHDAGVVYNAVVLVGPAGYIGKQRKLHMSRDEVRHYEVGDSIEVFDLEGCRVSVVICYDNNFPEIARVAALRGADVLLMPHAGRHAQWIDGDAASERSARQTTRYLHMGYAQRARENACFAVVTDQVGRAGVVDHLPADHLDQPHHPGDAIVFAPDGAVLAAAQGDAIRDEMIVTTLDASLLDRARASVGYQMRTRRPELFADIAAIA